MRPDYVERSAELDRIGDKARCAARDRAAAVSNKAMDSYWSVVAEHYPEIETGDMDPASSAEMHLFMQGVVEAWATVNSPEPLGREMHEAVVTWLRLRGWDASYEYGGWIGVNAGPFYLLIGQNGWDYGTVNIAFPAPSGESGLRVEPAQLGDIELPPLEADLPEMSNDAYYVAKVWSNTLRAFMCEQKVWCEHWPSATALPIPFLLEDG